MAEKEIHVSFPHSVHAKAVQPGCTLIPEGTLHQATHLRSEFIAAHLRPNTGPYYGPNCAVSMLSRAGSIVLPLIDVESCKYVRTV